MPVQSEVFLEVLHSVSDAMYLVDQERKIVFWNNAAERSTGYFYPEVMGKQCRNQLFRHTNYKGTCLCKDACPMERTFRDLRPREMDVYSHNKDGSRVLTRVVFSPVKDPAGRTLMAVKFNAAQGGCSASMRLYDEHYKKHQDPIPSVEDRKQIESRLLMKIDELRRYQWPFGAILFSVDRREHIIETYGYTYWYRVIRMLATTLTGSLRSSDTLGRWSENEFICIVLNVDNSNLKSIAERLRILVAQTQLMFYKEKISFTISLGASLAHTDDNIAALTDRCSLLLRKSISIGGNSTSI